MNPILGTAAVLVGFLGSIWLVVRGLRGLFIPAEATSERLFSPVAAVVGGAIGAMLILQIALLTDDFSVEYVANHSASTTPVIFKIASAWGALAGSIVLWGLTLALFIWTVYRRFAQKNEADPMWAGALGLLGIIGVFFFGLMLTASDPFRVCTQAGAVGCAQSTWQVWVAPQIPGAGVGPNPLLQNHFLMAVHPPVLYVGYVGLAVPWAFAMAALLIGQGGSAWLKASRSWTILSWGFLTAGIVLGGLWSYEVLGWGGYWAWDPVENASFIPWLVATAFIHSSIVQRRRGMLQAWNFMLVILAFAATILGTFLTRSGIISSVHSFSQSAVGPLLLWFLAFILITSFSVFALRISDIGSSSRLDSLSSREGFFLGNNLLLSVFAFVVLLGTVYPLFLEAITGVEAGVGPPFFNRFAIPLSLLLLLTMAFGSVAPWRSASRELLWNRTRTPLLVSFAASAGAVLIGWTDGYLLLGVFAGVLVIATAIGRLLAGAKRRTAKTEENAAKAAWSVLRGDGPYWSGQLSHIGVALLALGITLSANLGVSNSFAMEQFETVQFAGMELTYFETLVESEPHRDVLGARIAVVRDGKQVAILEPALNTYKPTGSVIGTPSVKMWFTGDLYLALDRIDAAGVGFTAIWHPYIWLVWVGGMLIGIAPLWSRLSRTSRRRSNVRAETPSEGAVT